jgi:hypothetical protein
VKLLRDVFVYRAARAYGDDSHGALSTVDAIDDAKSSDSEFPVFGELALERLAAVRVGGNRAYRLLDPTLDARRQVPDDSCRRRGNDELQHARARARFPVW